MKTLLSLAVGIAIGFGIAVISGKAEKKFVRLDQVTLTKEELDHVTRAIDLLKDKKPSLAYTRYVSDSGSVAFECPNDTECNLEIPARDRVKPRDVEVTVRQTWPTAVTGSITGVVRKRKDISEDSLREMKLVSITASGATASTGPNTGESIYEKLGLMNGDVVTAVNGESTDSPSDALKRLNALSDHFEKIREVSVLRDGKTIQLSFNRE
jgi:hypothetical protein